MNSQKITGLADPSSSSDAVTLSYVQALVKRNSYLTGTIVSGSVPGGADPAIVCSGFITSCAKTIAAGGNAIFTINYNDDFGADVYILCQLFADAAPNQNDMVVNPIVVFS
jgi:hypothetical protein